MKGLATLANQALMGHNRLNYHGGLPQTRCCFGLSHTQGRDCSSGLAYDPTQRAHTDRLTQHESMSDFMDSDTFPKPSREVGLRELVTRGVSGDERALEAIYYRFKTPIFNLAYRYSGDSDSAEDILQETFLSAFTHLGKLQEAASFSGWLYRIAVNACLGHVRSSKPERQRSVPLEDIDGKTLARDSGLSERSVEEDSALRSLLEGAIQVLPERLRLVFLMHDVEGFKHEEIATALGCTVGTSKSNLFKARMKLREKITKTTSATNIKNRELRPRFLGMRRGLETSVTPERNPDGEGCEPENGLAGPPE